MMGDKKHSTLFRSICNCMRINLLCMKQATLNLSPPNHTAIINRINTGQLLIFSMMGDKKHSTLFRSICNCMRINLLCIKQATLNLSPPNHIKKLSLAITVLGCIMKGKVSGGHSYCHHQSNKYRTASDFFNDGR